MAFYYNETHFLEQTHRLHSDLHEFAENQFELLATHIKQSLNISNYIHVEFET